ncbi:MAG: cation-transporting P-type ATPase [Candidatus Cyclonatronum sp.]|uniref:cation-transporting P-type ATPase n=1 Tax=Cyclonatronum sp. TaxID=3024185 RepID=UPI0025C6DFB1|nr:cation-transporting P-type ATPase [Cyclonatronum sp.]MCH8487152.1 cation-transporting P-type ATPase [Cyclonatronum sp.]
MKSRDDLRAQKWHSLSADETARLLATDPEKGLSEQEAKKRLAQFGPNKLPEQKQRGPLMRFLMQFHNALIYVLLGAAVVTALMGHWIDTWVILAVVVINALIGFVQEGKAEQALENLKQMLSLKATVVRDGKRTEIAAEELVPGDVVRLESGDKIPADIRFVYARNLKAEESALTGESQPVNKTTETVPEDAVVGDRKSLGFNSTVITYGRGTGLIFATGADTEIGKINTMMSEVEKMTTPLLRQIDGFGKSLSVIILALTSVMFAVGYFVHGDTYSVPDLFMAVIGLAVAAIPEGLPAIMTITLALGVQRMASKNAIIRKLPSVETLGSVTVICSDKTGTLTKNEMTATSLVSSADAFQVEGTGYAPEGDILTEKKEKADLSAKPVLARLIETVMLCNEAEIEQKDDRWILKGDPTEGALVTLGTKAGIDVGAWKRLDTIPFESDHKFMATLHEHRETGERIIFLKGAPERVIEMCSEQLTADGTEAMQAGFWKDRIDAIAEKGERVIAAAVRKVKGDVTQIEMKDVREGLQFAGLIGMIDPPRPEAIEAVKACKQAGIKVKMITGDHAITASAIGEQLGICEGRKAITGGELEKATDEELQKLVVEYDIFARTSPEHKLRLVKALQENGEVVAMTGDGVNDAPALKRASVGVAMGIKGTEVTKDASEMVLADDNFASIAKAVEEGRTIYDNLRKAILFILPTNGAEAFVIMAAILMGIALPITPVQILWVNMVTAVTLAIALSFEPSERGVMLRPPRDPKAPILGGYFIWRVAFVSLLIGGITLFLYYYLKDNGYQLEEARTIAINVLVAGQAFYLFNCRYLHESGFSRGFFDNKVALGAVGALIVFQLIFVYAPFMNLWFGTEPIKAGYWGWAVLAGFVVFCMVEAEKFVFRQIGE